MKAREGDLFSYDGHFHQAAINDDGKLSFGFADVKKGVLIFVNGKAKAAELVFNAVKTEIERPSFSPMEIHTQHEAELALGDVMINAEKVFGKHRSMRQGIDWTLALDWHHQLIIKDRGHNYIYLRDIFGNVNELVWQGDKKIDLLSISTSDFGDDLDLVTLLINSIRHDLKDKPLKIKNAEAGARWLNEDITSYKLLEQITLTTLNTEAQDVIKRIKAIYRVYSINELTGEQWKEVNKTDDGKKLKRFIYEKKYRDYSIDKAPQRRTMTRSEYSKLLREETFEEDIPIVRPFFAGQSLIVTAGTEDYLKPGFVLPGEDAKSLSDELIARVGGGKISAGVLRKKPLDYAMIDAHPTASHRILFKAGDKSSKPNYGGIDLTPARMNVQTQNPGGTITVHMGPAMLAQLQNSTGFEPDILSIQPMKNLREFLVTP